MGKVTLLASELTAATRDAEYICATAALMPYQSIERAEVVRLAADIAAHAYDIANRMDDVFDEWTLSLATWTATFDAFDEAHERFERKAGKANVGADDIDIFRHALHHLSVASQSLASIAAAMDAIEQSSVPIDASKTEEWSAWRKQCVAEADALFDKVHANVSK